MSPDTDTHNCWPDSGRHLTLHFSPTLTVSSGSRRGTLRKILSRHPTLRPPFMGPKVSGNWYYPSLLIGCEIGSHASVVHNNTGRGRNFCSWQGLVYLEMIFVKVSCSFMNDRERAIIDFNGNLLSRCGKMSCLFMKFRESSWKLKVFIYEFPGTFLEVHGLIR